jgi:hypothetical protein
VLGREVAQTMYTHVSKCKNDKIKGERKKKGLKMTVKKKVYFFVLTLSFFEAVLLYSLGCP